MLPGYDWEWRVGSSAVKVKLTSRTVENWFADCHVACVRARKRGTRALLSHTLQYLATQVAFFQAFVESGASRFSLLSFLSHVPTIWTPAATVYHARSTHASRTLHARSTHAHEFARGEKRKKRKKFIYVFICYFKITYRWRYLREKEKKV